MNVFPEIQEIIPSEEKPQPRCQVPWDKIDEWIAALDPHDEEQETRLLVDSGDRRN